MCVWTYRLTTSCYHQDYEWRGARNRDKGRAFSRIVAQFVTLCESRKGFGDRICSGVRKGNDAGSFSICPTLQGQLRKHGTEKFP